MPDATLLEICREGLEKANALDYIARAKNQWLHEVINDLWMNRGESWDRRMKTLQTTSTATLAIGQTRYAMPLDFDDEMEIVLMDNSTGLSSASYSALAGSISTTLKMAAADSITSAQATAIGQFVQLTSGVLSGQIRAVTGVTTGTATVSPAWTAVGTTTAPAASDTYSWIIPPFLTVSAGTASTVTLAAAETLAYTGGGTYIYFTAGTAKDQYRQIIAYDPNTFVATVDVAWDAGKTPVSGDSYLLVNSFTQMIEQPIDDNPSRSPVTKSAPKRFSKYNDELYFDNPPDKVYAIRFRYFANPTKISFTEGTGKLFTKMLTNWRAVLTQGLFVKALESSGAKLQAVQIAKAEYEKLRVELLAAEVPYNREFSQIGVDWWYTERRSLMGSGLTVGY